MAITTVTPVAESLLEVGDDLYFTVDDTYTTMLIEIDLDSALLVDAYDSTSDGFQSGFEGSVVDNGDGTHTFRVRRPAGFDLTPFTIKVTEDEADPGGATTETTTTYYLEGEKTFPQGEKPYNGTADGVLAVLDEGVVSASTVAILDFFGFTVEKISDTRVKITDTGGGGDSDAIHDNVAGEINAITGKSNPVDADILLLEDSADSFNKKKLILSNLLATLSTQSGAGIWQYAGDADTTPASAKFSFDTSGVGIAANCYIHENSLATGIDSGTLLGALGAGDYIYIGHASLRTVGSFHKLTGTPTLTANVWDIPLDGATSGEYTTVGFTLDDYCYLLPLFAAGGGGGFADAPDAALFTERADHVNTPASGFHEVWVRSDVTGSLMFTNDGGIDYVVPTIAGTPAAGDIPYVSDLTGKMIVNTAFGYSNASNFLYLNTAGGGLQLTEGATPTASPGAGKGTFWVKNTSPTEAYFRDSSNIDYSLKPVQTVVWTGSLVHQQNFWQTCAYANGMYQDASWTQSAGSSGSGSITVDPIVYRYANQLFLPVAVTLLSIDYVFTSGTAHSAYDTYLDVWRADVVDGATTDDASPTRIARSQHTMDGTHNKAYHVSASLDTDAVAASSMLCFYHASPDAASASEALRMTCTIRYREN